MNAIKVKVFAAFLWFVPAFTALAQSESVPVALEPGDTLPTSLPRYLVPEGVPDTPSPLPLPLEPWNPDEAAARVAAPLWSLPALPLSIPSADIVSWTGGGISGIGSVADMPGLMGVRQMGLQASQRFGDFSVSAWADMSHIGYFRGMQRAWSVGGSIDYRISSQLSLTLFGRYVSPLYAPTAAMAGYMGTSGFGGMLNYDFAPHWGVSVGAQTSRSLVTGHWETRPIVMPYYRVNSSVKIGVDVGGIIHGIVSSYLESRAARRSPVIGPPPRAPLPVGPRR